jgi:hypothetical protein
MHRTLAVLLMVVAPWAVPRSAAAQNPVAFDDPAWVIERDAATIDRYLDRQALRLRTGIELRTEPPEGTAPIRRSAGTPRPGAMGGR